MITTAVETSIKKVCPIVGVSFGRLDDKTTWRIDFTDDANDEQRKAAQEALDAFDVKTFEQRASILAQLDEIDALLKLRTIREGLRGLGAVIEYLRNTPDDGTPLAKYLRALPSAGTGMGKLIQVDDLAVAKRAELAPK